MYLLSILSNPIAWVDFHLSPVSLFKIGAAATHGFRNLGWAKDPAEVEPPVFSNDTVKFDFKAPLADAEASLWVAIKFAKALNKIDFKKVIPRTFLDEGESSTIVVLLLRAPEVGPRDTGDQIFLHNCKI